jgi:hypothetical protein
MASAELYKKKFSHLGKQKFSSQQATWRRPRGSTRKKNVFSHVTLREFFFPPFQATWRRPRVYMRSHLLACEETSLDLVEDVLVQVVGSRCIKRKMK